jgi:hypothetical protein
VAYGSSNVAPIVLVSSDLNHAAFGAKQYDEGREERIRRMYALNATEINPRTVFPETLLPGIGLTPVLTAVPLRPAGSLGSLDLGEAVRALPVAISTEPEIARISPVSDSEDEEKDDGRPPSAKNDNLPSPLPMNLAIDRPTPLPFQRGPGHRGGGVPVSSLTLANLESLLRKLILELQLARKDADVAKYLHSLVIKLLYAERGTLQAIGGSAAIIVAASAAPATQNHGHWAAVTIKIIETALKIGSAGAYAAGYGLMARSKAATITDLAQGRELTRF